jgi:hypothetical protein
MLMVPQLGTDARDYRDSCGATGSEGEPDDLTPTKRHTSARTVRRSGSQEAGPQLHENILARCRYPGLVGRRDIICSSFALAKHGRVTLKIGVYGSGVSPNRVGLRLSLAGPRTHRAHPTGPHCPRAAYGAAGALRAGVTEIRRGNRAAFVP